MDHHFDLRMECLPVVAQLAGARHTSHRVAESFKIIREVTGVSTDVGLVCGLHFVVSYLLGSQGVQVPDHELLVSAGSEIGHRLDGPVQTNTRVHRHADAWLVTGHKYFVSGVSVADGAVVWARDDDGALRYCLVPLDQAAVTVEPTWRAAALVRSASDAVTFDAAAAVATVPREQLRHLLPIYSITYSAVHLAIVDVTVERLAEFVAGRGSLAGSDWVLEGLGALAWRAQAARALLSEVLAGWEGVEQGGAELADMAVCVAALRAAVAEASQQTHVWGLQVVGGNGLRLDHGLGQLLRDVEAGVVMPPSKRRAERALGLHRIGEELPLVDVS